MTSIFEKALGADYQLLHPMLQRRFGVDVDARYACVGCGTFTEVRRGAWWTVPFLRLGAFRNILFPDRGTNIPFTIENYPYLDGFGRPTVTFVRTLELSPGRTRRFDATMIYSEESGGIIDYLGTHQHLATGLELEVLADGSLHLRSTGQRFFEGLIGFNFPAALTGIADLYETYDDVREVSRSKCRCGIRYLGSFSAIGANSHALFLPSQAKTLHSTSNLSGKKNATRSRK